MKKIILSLAILSIAISGFTQVDRTKAPAPGPAREIKLGEYETFTLKNGLQVFVVENHKLPRIQFSLELKNNPILEGDKAGYVSLAGDLIGTGTTTRTKAQLDEEVDFIGANLNTSASGVFASSLSKHTNKLLELMSDVLLNPAFPQSELDKLKTQTLSALAASKDNPNAIASNVRSVLIYGKDHPYGELTTEETVGAVTLDDCKKYYNTYFKPGNAYLAIVGDINQKSAKAMAEKYFGKWAKGDAPNPTYATPKLPEKRVVALVDRSASVQSVISIGYPVELKPGEPDVIKANVLNQILGGGFSSRLMQNLREDKAFTYGARSSLSSDKLVGSFNASASVRNAVTDSAVHEFLYELQRIRQDTVMSKELLAAKASIAGAFGRSLENPRTVANFALNIAKYNLPKDYYENYVKNVEAVTKEEVLNVAKKYILPDHTYVVVVGKASDISDGLKQFGDIKYYDIHGNSYVPSKASALPAGLTAEKVISDYISKLGGAERIKSIKTIKSSSKGTVPGAELIVNSVQKSPNKGMVEINANGMTFQKIVCDGENIVITQMGQKTPLDEATKEETVFEFHLVPELYYKEAGIKIAVTGVEKVEGKDAYVVEFTFPSGNKSSQYFDAETGLKVKSVKTLNTPQGQMTQSIGYQDYKEYGGVKFPQVITQNIGPQTLKLEVTSMEVNVPVEDEAFKLEK